MTGPPAPVDEALPYQPLIANRLETVRHKLLQGIKVREGRIVIELRPPIEINKDSIEEMLFNMLGWSDNRRNLVETGNSYG